MVKQIVFGSFDHPFQDGNKNFCHTDIVTLASYLLWYFLYARTVTKSWCSVGIVFWQMDKLQIHKMASNHDH